MSPFILIFGDIITLICVCAIFRFMVYDHYKDLLNYWNTNMRGEYLGTVILTSIMMLIVIVMYIGQLYLTKMIFDLDAAALKLQTQ